MIQSQENCLPNNHRFTHERWGGDFNATSRLAVFWHLHQMLVNGFICVGMVSHKLGGHFFVSVYVAERLI